MITYQWNIEWRAYCEHTTSAPSVAINVRSDSDRKSRSLEAQSPIGNSRVYRLVLQTRLEHVVESVGNVLSSFSAMKHKSTQFALFRWRCNCRTKFEQLCVVWPLHYYVLRFHRFPEMIEIVTRSILKSNRVKNAGRMQFHRLRKHEQKDRDSSILYD